MADAATSASSRVVMIAALSINPLLRNLVDWAGALAIARLATTCKGLRAIVAADGAYCYSGFPARRLASQGLKGALAERWRRFGRPGAEVDAALVEMARAGQVAAIRWLLTDQFPTAPGSKQKAPLRPSAATIDLVLERLAEHDKLQCDFMTWLVGEHPVRPSSHSLHRAFITVCGRGKLGLAEIAFRALTPPPRNARRQFELYTDALGAPDAACHGHIVRWAREGIERLRSSGAVRTAK